MHMSAIGIDIMSSRQRLYAFFGNSLLGAMTEETSIGLDPEFWEALVGGSLNGEYDTGLENMIEAVMALSRYDRAKAVQMVAVDYTRLFVGPGKPAVPIWETLYKNETSYTFGRQTLEVKQVLHSQGLRLSGQSNQLEDHMGIELLLLSEMSRQTIDSCAAEGLIREQIAFIDEHPLSWVKPLRDCVRRAERTGYYSALLTIIAGYLQYDISVLRELSSSSHGISSPSSLTISK